MVFLYICSRIHIAEKHLWLLQLCLSVLMNCTTMENHSFPYSSQIFWQSKRQWVLSGAKPFCPCCHHWNTRRTNLSRSCSGGLATINGVAYSKLLGNKHWNFVICWVRMSSIPQSFLVHILINKIGRGGMG